MHMQSGYAFFFLFFMRCSSLFKKIYIYAYVVYETREVINK